MTAHGPTMTTTAPAYADVPMGHYCVICDRDRTEADRFAGVLRGDDLTGST